MPSRLLLLFLLCSALVVVARPEIAVRLTVPAVVHNVDNFKLVATISNTGDETLRLLNHPNTLLSKKPTDLFSVRNSHGADPSFVGIKVNYALEHALVSGSPRALTVLAPGQSLRIEHDLSHAYDFSASGPGQYTVEIKGSNPFYYVSGTQANVLFHGGQSTHTVHLSGRVRPQSRPFHENAHLFSKCSRKEVKEIEEAIPTAVNYTRNAHQELSRGYSDTYNLWFGPYHSRFETVKSHFKKLTANKYHEYEYKCHTEYCDDDTIAYVFPQRFGEVHLCKLFFDLPVGGRMSQAVAIVHESTHFTINGGTDDIAYGEAQCQQLAEYAPESAIMNAANHHYFAADAKGDEEAGAVSTEEHRVVVAQAYYGVDHVGSL